MASSGIIPSDWLEECSACCVASKRRSSYSSGFVKKEFGNRVCIAFSGSPDCNAFSQATDKFGVCKINDNNDCFKSMIDGSARTLVPEPALVHQGALNQFLDIWRNSTLQQEVAEALAGGKIIFFTGHSIGGAIATLAALSTLEKRHNGTCVFCVTFGFPLIGDDVLARAVRRQGWANQFCHIVLRGDIFSRILLAPCIAVASPLEVLLPYWERSMQQMDDDETLHSSTDIPMEEAFPGHLDIPKFFNTVLQHACEVSNYGTVANMDPTNKLIAALKPVLKSSPYRPFGNYVFCSGNSAVWVENYEAVLPILYYGLASATQDQSYEESILEHVGYGKVLPNVITNMVKLEGLSNLALQPAAAQPTQLATQLDALGLGIQNSQARLALRYAGEIEKQLRENAIELEEKLKKLEKEGGPLTQLKLYRNRCLEQRILGYYDCFKQHERDEDFQANINRLKLAGFFDKVVEMVEKHRLPDDFQCREEWIRAGTDYRLLVEPLDIANYYRLGKHEDSGHYFKFARPLRYKAFQKWFSDKQLNGNQVLVVMYHQPEITQDSCFWAYIEEITHSMNNGHGDVSGMCQKFQRMIDSNEVRVDEVVMGESSFVKWWNMVSPHDRNASPLSSVFNVNA